MECNSINNSKIKLNIPLDEMVSIYLKSVNKNELDYEVLYDKSKGFITFAIIGETMIIPDLYGDGKYWLGVAEKIAKENNCTKLKGGTTRNPKAYERMFGTKIVGYILEKDL